METSDPAAVTVRSALRVLMVEDSEDDALLVLYELRRAGHAMAHDRVWSAEAMRAALAREPWDVIICDHRMPQFDAFGALELVNAAGLDIPFIIVSGAIGEETAVAAMKAGAHDYLIKDNIKRLPAAVERELQAAAARRRHAQTEQALRESENSLHDTEKLYRAIFEQAPDSIVIVEAATGAIVAFNDRACERLGYTRAEFERLKIPDFEVEESPEAYARHLDRISHEGSDVFETRHRRKDGEIRYALVSTRTLAIGGKPLIHSIWTDITEGKKVEEELRQAVTRLRDLDRMRQEFVSNVSHEMKTPLASIMHATQNLIKGVTGPLPADSQRYLRMMDGEARRLLNTVNDILDMRQIETQTLRLTIVRLSFARLVGRRCEATRGPMDEKRLSLTVTADRKAGFVRCDAEKLERVVNNILSNALKYTPPDGAVRVEVRRDPESPERVLLTVEDNGIGIPAIDLPHIAERYFRAGNHVTGTGLGLAISKEIVRLHDGDLTVVSPPPDYPNGTLVRVRLPIAKPCVVLVIDEESAVRDVVEHRLSEYGYLVMLADAADASLQQAADVRPDCIVLNVTDGCDLAIRLKCRPDLRDLPTVAVCDSATDANCRKILDDLQIPLLSKLRLKDALVDGVEQELITRAILRHRHSATHEGGKTS